MIQRPLLTVVIPVYNGGDEIVENVAVIQRTVSSGMLGEDVEVIVVSDGSIDDTTERLLAARSQAGIRVIHYDRNLGKGYAVKIGALAAHGEWVALIDADLDLDPASVPLFSKWLVVKTWTSRSGRSAIPIRSCTIRGPAGSQAGAISS